jgi:N-acyl-phosphatidylethanolamine-hydrolysing phospholipase D
MKKRLSALLLAAGLLCTVVVHADNPYFDAGKAHHRRDGFVNSDGSRIEKSPAQLWRWIRENLGSGLPRPPSEFIDGYRFPVLKPDLAYLRANRSEVSFTWLGHASILLQSGGLNILMDPIFSDRAAPVQWAGPRRKVPSPLRLEDLPPIDAVLISHNHYDHMDADSLLGIATHSPQAVFLVPLGTERWFEKQGIQRAVGLDWWASHTIGQVEIHCVPARHWSVRTFMDRNENLWGGWVVNSPSHRFYYAGDTGYSADFKAIGERFGGFDLAAIPVGAYSPRWFMQDQHIGPAEAMDVHKDVRAAQSIGVHWGTFELSLEPLDAPLGDIPKAAEQAGLAADAFILIRHGETLRWPSAPLQATSP